MYLDYDKLFRSNEIHGELLFELFDIFIYVKVLVVLHLLKAHSISTFGRDGYLGDRVESAKVVCKFFKSRIFFVFVESINYSKL